MSCIVLNSSDNVAEEKADSTVKYKVYTKTEYGWVYENQS